MPEIVQFVEHHAASVTRHTIEKLLEHLPMLKLEFTAIDAPAFPHLFEQIEFLADVVEDFDADHQLPLVVVAEAAFALMYVHKRLDLIPDFLERMGRADDSSVVRAILMRHEKALRAFAERHSLDWSRVTVKP